MLKISNEEWQKALVKIQDYCDEHLADKTEYSTRSLDDDHGCPQPITSYQPDNSEDKGTDVLWNGRRVLWCYPAEPDEGKSLREGENIPVACLGTTFWCIIHAFKELGLEKEITKKEIGTLKTVSLLNSNGIAQAFVKLGWAKGLFTDPNIAQEGDVGVIGYEGELPHHWFLVAPNPHIEIYNKKALDTWAASPLAEGAGYDYWFKNKTNNKGKKRYWILARPFA